MDKFYCYLITNQINDKVYVGITNNPEKRWTDHKQYGRNTTNKKHYKSTLYIAMEKHLVDNFTFDIISVKNTRRKILEEEIKYIKLYNSFYEDGYNMTKGGEGDSGGGKKTVSDGQKKLLSKLTIKQMSNPKNRELSRQGALKQWKNMSDKEMKVRAEGMRKRAFKLHSDPVKKANIYKKIQKKVVAHGVAYESVNACAKAFGVKANTITCRCQSKHNNDFYYLNNKKKGNK